METIKVTIKRQADFFMCSKNELERINEGLQSRGIDSDSIINIIDNGDFVTIWYRITV